MRYIKKFPVSILAGALVVIEFSLLIYQISAAKTGPSNSDDGAVFIVIQIFWCLLFLAMFCHVVSDELKNYKKEGVKMFGKSKEKEVGLVSRSEIANMLKQYQRNEISPTKLSKADLEFIKTLLLPVKARLIKGLQDYSGGRNIDFDEYQFDYADKCIQSIREGDLHWALNWLTSIYKCGSPFQTYCNYSELIVNLLLVSNLIEMCDRMLEKMTEIEKWSNSKEGLIQEAVSDVRQLDDLESRLEFWHEYRHNESLMEYLGLTDEENNFIQKSLCEAIRAVVACRKNNVSINDYAERIQDKISCFFPALGAPGRRAGTDSNTRIRGKIL